MRPLFLMTVLCLSFASSLFAQTPVIGVAKDANLTGRNIRLDFYLEAFGTDNLTNIAMSDDLDAVFGAGNYLIATSPFIVFDPGGGIVLNPNYDGSTDVVMISSGTLSVGSTAHIQMTIEITNPAMGPIYNNQVTATADGVISAAMTSDLSDDGTDPDPDEDDDPTGADENDTTVINLGVALENPVIGVAKDASLNGTQVTFDFYLRNYGDVTLSNLSLTDDLDGVFGAGNYSVLGAPSFVDDPMTMTLNAGFDGSSDTELISSGTFAVGDTAQIRVTVDVTSVVNGGAYENQALAMAEGPAGGDTDDLSDAGTNPDGDRDGNPGGPNEADPTAFLLGEEPQIGVAKTAGSTGSLVTFDYYLENLGNVTLSNLSLEEDLLSVFGAGNVLIDTAAVFIDDPGTITLNPNFDGLSDTEMITSGTLAQGDTAQIRLVLFVALSDQGSGIGVYENQVTASGEAPGGSVSTDLSDDGADPDPNGNGDPGDAGEDDPTAFVVAENASVGVAHETIITPLTATAFNIRMVYRVENLGNVSLTLPIFIDDYDDIFGAGNYFVSGRVISGNASIPLNNGFNGSTNTVLVNNGTMGVSEFFNLEISLTVVNVVDMGSGLGVYENQVQLSMDAPSGATVSDLSDSGSVPDPNGNGDAGDAGEDDPTPIIYGENIGGALDASVSGNQVTFDYYIENLGTTTIDTIDVGLPLNVIGSGNFNVVSVNQVAGSLTLNPGYDGFADSGLVDPASSMAAGETSQIRVVVDVTNITNTTFGGTIGNYSVQGTLSALGTTDGVLQDTTDNGTDPDPDMDGIGNEAGENDATPIAFNLDGMLGAAKNVAVAGNQLTIDLYIENFGAGVSSNVSLLNDLDAAFGAGNYSITVAPAFVGGSDGLTLNAGFDGSGDTELLTAGGTLSGGTVVQIQMVVDITTIEDQGMGTGVFSCQAFVTGTDANGFTLTDASTDGTDPDLNGNNDPTTPGLADPPVAGDDDPTVFIVGDSAIGIAFHAIVDGVQVTFDVYMENIGDTDIDNINISDPILSRHSFGNFSVVSTPVVLEGPATIQPNTGFSAFSQQVVFSSTLKAGESARLRYIINVDTLESGGQYNGQLTISGLDPLDNPVIDLSDNGILSDPNGNGIANEAGENDTTFYDVNVPEQAIIGVAIDAGAVGQQITLDYYIENLGNVLLSGLSMPANLDDVFGAGNYSINTGPAIIGGADGVVLEGAYDGSANTELLDVSTLSSGTTVQIRTVVDVTNVVTQGFGVGFYRHQVIATGSGPNGSISQDRSDEGIDPDADADGDPSVVNESDFTSIVISSIVLGAALDATVAGNTITLIYTVESFGSGAVTNLSADVDLDAIFGAGNYSVNIVASRNITENMSFDGSSDTTLFSGQTLAGGTNGAVELNVDVTTLVDNGSGLGAYSAQFTANGTGVMDLSHPGIDPDPDGDNIPTESGENDPTTFTLAEDPLIGVALDASVSGDNVTLQFTLESFANVSPTAIDLPYDLDALLGAGNYTIASAPAFGDDPGTLVLNAAYDGGADTALIDSGTLAPGDTASFTVVVHLVELTDVGSGLGVYSTQVTVTATSPDSTMLSDLSDNGTDPDPVINNDPTGVNENDPTPFTVAEDPVVGAALEINVLGDVVTLDYRLENHGNVILDTFSLPNDLDAVLGAGNYSVTSGPSFTDDPGTLTLNAGFNGSGDTALISAGTLGVGDTAAIRVVVTVSQVTDQGGGLGIYSNQVTASAQGPGGGPTSDLSDDGADPDPNGNDDPTEAGENDASPFSVAERVVIGVAKDAGVAGNAVTLDFYLENFGNVPVLNLSLPDDLDAVFGTGNYSISSGPSFIDDPGTIVLNAGYDGSASTGLITGGSLGLADTAQIRVVVNVNEVTDQGGGVGAYSNQVTVMGQGPSGAFGSDVSDSGTDPDPNGSGDPTEAGENDATPITVTEDPVIGVAKNASVSGAQVTFDYYLESFGNVALTNLALAEDLDTVLGAGNYSISSAPAFIDDPGTITLNAAFDGSANTSVISSGTLNHLDTAQIRVVVTVTEVTDQGGGFGMYSNQVTAMADGLGGTMTSDLSDGGTDPDPNGSGDPTEAGENDATAFTVIENAVAGVALDINVSGNDVTFDYTIENFGNSSLGNLAIVSDLDAVLGAGNYTISSAPAFTTDPGTVTLNAAYDGSANTGLISAGTLGVGGIGVIRVVATVTQVTDQGGGLGIYSHQVTFNADGAGGSMTSDLSDDGADPDPNGNGDPTEAGENDASPFTVAEQATIGLALNAGVTGNNVTLDYYLENLGNVAISNLALPQDLDAVLGAGLYSIAVAPAFIDDPGTITINAAFDGSGDTALITSGTLAVGDTAQIQVVVTVNEVTDQGGGLGMYSAAATVTGQGTSGAAASDLSDFGTDPDPNGNADPTEAGEGDPTTFTVVETPVIGLAKTANVSGNEVTFDYYLEGFGNVALTNLTLTENLDAVLGAGNYNISTAPALIDDPGTITLNAAFNGSGDTSVISSGGLNHLDTAQIRVVVTVTQVTDQGGGFGIYSNQATATADGAGGTMTSDLSDDGTDPDPNGNSDPTEAGENDATAFVVVEDAVAGVALDINVSGNDVTFDYTIENLGNSLLSNLAIASDLDAVLGASNYTISSAPAFTSDPGGITLNAAYDGSGNTAILSAGSLGVGSSAVIRVVATVTQVTDQGGGLGIYTHQVTFSADGAGGTMTSDLSDDGTDPDPNGNDDPTEAGENDASPFTVAEQAVIGLALNSGVSGNDVTLDYYLENFGNVPVSSLALPQALDAVFGAGLYSISAAPVFIDDPGTITLNAAYDGSGDTALITTGTLAVSDTAQIRVVVTLIEVTDQGGGLGVYSAAATVNGQGSSGAATSDLSDAGTDPDPNGNGDPTEAGEGDPTPITVAEDAIIGLALNDSVVGDDVTLDYALENLGNVLLSSVDIVDNLDAAFGAGNYTVTAAPVFTDDPGTLTLNAGFDGSAATSLLTGGTLAVGDTAVIRIVATLSNVTDQGGGLGIYTDQATASAQGPSSAATSDLSDDGTDPDPNGNGDPTEAGEDDPTAITVAENPVVGLAQSTGAGVINGDGSYNVPITFTIENLGNVQLSSVQIVNDLDTTFAGAPTYTIEVAPASATLTANAAFNGSGDPNLLTGADSLDVGETATLSFTVRFDPQGEAGPFNNSATANAASPVATPATDLSDDGADPDPNGNNDPTEAGENDATPIEIPQGPLIAATIVDTVIPSREADVGQTIEYVATITNNGNQPALGVIYTSTPDPNSNLVIPISASQGSITSGANPGDATVAVSLGSIAPAASATVTYRVVIDIPLPPGVNSITIQGLVTGDNFPDTSTDDPSEGGSSDPTVTLINNTPFMDATKSWSLTVDNDIDSQVDPTDTITYTVVVTNNGIADADGVVFTTDIDPGSEIDTPNTVTTTQGSVTSGATPGDTTVTVDLGTVAPNGGSATITFQVRVIDDPRPATELSCQGTITGSNISTLVTDDPSTDGLLDATITPLNFNPDMIHLKEGVALFMGADQTLSAGDVVQYNVEIQNNGLGETINAVFTDTPDPNTTLNVGSVTTSQGTVVSGNTAGDTSVQIDLGAIPPDGGTVNITFTVTVGEGAQLAGRIQNQAFLNGDNFDEVPSNDPNTGPDGDPATNLIVPTLQEWMLIIFIMLMMAAAVVFKRQEARTQMQEVRKQKRD